MSDTVTWILIALQIGLIVFLSALLSCMWFISVDWQDTYGLPHAVVEECVANVAAKLETNKNW